MFCLNLFFPMVDDDLFLDQAEYFHLYLDAPFCNNEEIDHIYFQFYCPTAQF